MVKVGKSILKIAQILRSPATISSFATCLQSVSLCFHPIHSHPVKEKKAAINPIQSSFWVKSPFSGLTRVTYVIFKSLFMAVQLVFFINAQARINSPVRPSVWDLCRFCMTRPEPRPTTFISGQETLASVAYQGGSIWSMVGQQVET